MTREAFTGLVLAGGAGRRFGSNKALYRFGGHTMIESVVEAVDPLVRDLILSVGGAEGAREIAEFLQVEGGRSRHSVSGFERATVVRDHFPSAGPLAGLHAGLTAMKTHWLLVAACDMPFITTDALENLVNRCEPGLMAVVAVDSHGRRHPACACYHRSVAPVVDERIRAEVRSLHGLLDVVDVAEVALPDATLRNINSPADIPRT